MIITPRTILAVNDEGTVSDVRGATLTNNTSTSTTGKSGLARNFSSNDLEFNGTPTRLQDFSQGLTICTWVYFTSDLTSGYPAGNQPIALKLQNGATGAGVYYWILTKVESTGGVNRANRFEFGFLNRSGGDRYQTKNSLTQITNTNVWYHLAMSWDGEATLANLKMYLNGLDDTGVITSNNLPATINNSTGSLKLGNYANVLYLKGRLDSFKMFNRQLSQSDIRRVMLGLHPLGV